MEIAGCSRAVQVQRPPGGAAPAFTASVIMREHFKLFQSKQDLEAQRAGWSLGLETNGRHGRAWKDLLTAKGRATGDVLTMSAATRSVDGRGVSRSPWAPAVCPTGMGIWEVPFDLVAVSPYLPNEACTWMN